MANPYTIKNLVEKTGATEEQVRTLLIDIRDDADTCKMITKAQFEAIAQSLSGSNNLVLTSATSEVEQREQQQIVATAMELLDTNLMVSFQTDFIALGQSLKLRNQAIESLYDAADYDLADRLDQRAKQRFCSYQQVLAGIADQVQEVRNVKPSNTNELTTFMADIEAKVAKKLGR